MEAFAARALRLLASALRLMRPLDVLDLDDDLSPEELEVRKRVAGWAAERVAPRIAALYERGEWDRSLARELGELGVLGMHLDGHGCAGKSAVEDGVASHGARGGRQRPAHVRLRAGLAARCRRSTSGGSEEQTRHGCRRWPPARRSAASRSRAGGRERIRRAAAIARRESGEWMLNGTKRWIGLGSIAEVAVVWAQTDDGVRGFLVPTDTPGFTARDITDKLAMRASMQCELRFEAAPPRRRGARRRGPARAVHLALRGALRDRLGRDGAARDCFEARWGYARRARAVRPANRRLPAHAGASSWRWRLALGRARCSRCGSGG